MQLLVDIDPVMSGKLEAYQDEIAAIVAKLRRQDLPEGRRGKLKYRLGMLREKTSKFVPEG